MSIIEYLNICTVIVPYVPSPGCREEIGEPLKWYSPRSGEYWRVDLDIFGSKVLSWHVWRLQVPDGLVECIFCFLPLGLSCHIMPVLCCFLTNGGTDQGCCSQSCCIKARDPPSIRPRCVNIKQPQQELWGGFAQKSARPWLTPRESCRRASPKKRASAWRVDTRCVGYIWLFEIRTIQEQVRSHETTSSHPLFSCCIPDPRSFWRAFCFAACVCVCEVYVAHRHSPSAALGRMMGYCCMHCMYLIPSAVRSQAKGKAEVEAGCCHRKCMKMPLNKQLSIAFHCSPGWRLD